MTRVIGSVVVILVLVGCYRAPDLPGPRSSPQDAPLRAWILPPSFGIGGGFSFYVNRPAHAALFEIVPGRGIGLVYPRLYNQNRPAYAGLNRVYEGIGAFRWSYLSAPPAFSFGGVGAIRPRYYLLVASDHPLDISEYVQRAGGLRSELGIHQFAAWNPFRAVDQVTDLILPPAAHQTGNWVTDLYVDWPLPPAMAVAPSYRMVFCGDGSRLLVRSNSGVRYCPRDRPLAGSPDARPRSGDEGFREPRRRSPVPADDGDGNASTRRGEDDVRAPVRRAADEGVTRTADEPRRSPRAARPTSDGDSRRARPETRRRPSADRGARSPARDRGTPRSIDRPRSEPRRNPPAVRTGGRSVSRPAPTEGKRPPL